MKTETIAFDSRAEMKDFITTFFLKRASACGKISRVSRKHVIAGDDAWIEHTQRGEILRETGFLTLEIPEEFSETAQQIRTAFAYGW